MPNKFSAGHMVPCCLADILLRARGLEAREEIESALETASKTLAEMGAKSFEPNVLIRRALLARLSGDEDGCRREISEAHRLLTEMGAMPRAVQLEKELGLASDKR